MNTFPDITTERLILRDFNVADVNAFFAMFSDGRVTEFYDIDTFAIVEQAMVFVETHIRRNAAQDGSSLRWVICLEDAPGAGDWLLRLSFDQQGFSVHRDWLRASPRSLGERLCL